MRHFPDQMHVDRIRAALWRGREFGKAAVMVGAGFSLNAEPRLRSAPSFPTWAQLSKRLVAELYPQGAFSDKDREEAIRQAGSTGGVLRIAQEYEAAFGRDALDSFLLREIPDEGFDPSHLHRLLLKLPWSDVLTTNYDTLLERATDELVDRKYDVVRTVRDIPSAAKPRIVKLHGSFPSVRPFIFTEEDFRTYPRRFAPFVNLAQQSIMENIFCLIGFSGDDPNFLYWTGWVRDNLGSSAPRIYLCGLLDLTTARRNMLHERNVVPIDLSPLFLGDVLPCASRHAKAFEWLLLNLEAGEPPSPLTWPKLASVARTSPSEGLPEVPEREKPMPEGLPSWKHSDTEFVERLPALLRSWKHSRAMYPGWLIAPSRIRDAVWDELKYTTLPKIIKTASSLEPIQRIELLSHLNWWLELCLAPLWPDVAQLMSEALTEINPFPEVLELPEAGLQPKVRTSDGTDWSTLRDAWAELGLAVLRYSREEQDLDAFEEWRSRLELLVPQIPPLSSPIRYQQCLLALSRLDHATVRTVLRDWRVTDDDPVWLLRKASVLSEIREGREARALAEEALAAIRRKTRPGVGDIAMLSREGWAMTLLGALRWLDDHKPSDFRGRWVQLTAYDCSPLPELKLLETTLAGPAPRESARKSESIPFDPGHMTRHIYFGTKGLVSVLLRASQAVRLTEEAAHPGVCGRVALSKDLLASAAKWLEAGLPQRAMGVVLRLADRKETERFFSRHRMAAMSTEQVNDLYEMVSSAVSYGLSALPGLPVNDNREQRIALADQLAVPLELLSRLAARLSPSIVEKELDRIAELYEAPAIRFALTLASELKVLMRRFFQAASSTSLGTHLLRFMSLPIPEVEGFEVPNVEFWPEPAEYLPARVVPPQRDEKKLEWARCIRWLTEAAKLKTKSARSRAILRLAHLYWWGFLRTTEEKQFMKALWAHRGDSGLPGLTSLPDCSFLRLPEPSPGCASESFKQRYLQSTPPPVRQQVKQPDGTVHTSTYFGVGRHRWFDEIIGATRRTDLVSGRNEEPLIDWTPQEAELIFQTLCTWWREEGRKMCSEKAHVATSPEVEACIEAVLDVIRVSIGPRCAKGDNVTMGVKDLLVEIEQAGFPIEGALVSLLSAFPNLESEMTDRIRRGLVSQNHDQALAAIGALYDWLQRSNAVTIAPPPGDLIGEVGSIISSRRLPVIRHALPVATALVQHMPAKLNEAFVNATCVGLHYLLEETQYHSSPHDAPATLPYEEIPEYRSKAARLAAALAASSLTTDAVVKRWLESARSDPLPEVRRSIDPGESTYDDE